LENIKTLLTAEHAEIAERNPMQSDGHIFSEFLRVLCDLCGD
jgi:hypothetical protein